MVKSTNKTEEKKDQSQIGKKRTLIMKLTLMKMKFLQKLIRGIHKFPGSLGKFPRTKLRLDKNRKVNIITKNIKRKCIILLDPRSM